MPPAPPKTAAPRSPRFGGFGVAVLVCWAIAGIVLVVTLVPLWTPDIGLFDGGADLFVYRDGGWRAQHGMALYTVPMQLGLLYTYTPFSTLLFVPLSWIPATICWQVWMGANVVMLALGVLASFRLSGVALSRAGTLGAVLAVTAGCLFLEPVRTTLFYGQINLWLLAALLADALLGRSRRFGRFQGILTGIAAGIKLTPLYFVAYFAALGRWRAALTAALSFAATVAVAWAVLPDDSHQYWTDTFFDSSRIAADTDPANQSIRGVIAHLSHADAPTALWLALTGLVFVVGTGLAVLAARRGDRLLSITLAGMTAALISPFSWAHHWVWFVPLAVWVVAHAVGDRRWWAALPVLVVAAGTWTYSWQAEWGRGTVVGWFLFPPDGATAPLHLNVYPLVALVTMAATAYAYRGDLARLTRRGARPPVRPPGEPAAPEPPLPAPRR